MNPVVTSYEARLQRLRDARARLAEAERAFRDAKAVADEARAAVYAAWDDLIPSSQETTTCPITP